MPAQAEQPQGGKSGREERAATETADHARRRAPSSSRRGSAAAALERQRAVEAASTTTDGPNLRAETTLWTTKEAAERLKVSYEWLKKKAQRNEVPCVRLGRHVRFSEQNLLQIIRDGTQQPPTADNSRGSARTTL